MTLMSTRFLNDRDIVAPLNQDVDVRSRRIWMAAITAAGRGTIFHVLTDTPEQLEDLLVVLVDDDLVVRFELPRDQPTAPPRDVQRYVVDEYLGALNGRARHKLQLAIASARTAISGPGG